MKIKHSGYACLAVAVLAVAAIAALALPSPIVMSLDTFGPWADRFGPWVDDFSVANLSLVALRERLERLQARAEEIEGQVRDDLDDDEARALDEEHVEITGQIEETRSEITRIETEGSGNDGGQRQERSDPEPLTAAQAADIASIGRRAGMDGERIENAIRSNTSVETFRSQAFDFMAERAAATRTSPGRVMRDERETRVAAITEAMAFRMGAPIGESDLSEAARPFVAQRSISGFAAEALGEAGRFDSTRALDDLFERASHTTSDFPAIFEGAINRTLEGRYALAQPTYRRIARRSDFRDFRPHTTVKLGDFPMLEKVAEDGEIRYGTFSEGKEQVAAFAYARAITVTRKMLINDDLGAIGELLASYGDTVALFEEITFYGTAFNGKLADNKAVFHADHGNLAGTGGAIAVDTVSAGRTAMSKQKTLDGNPMLANPARILLCGPDTITDAEKLVASITPATVSNVNIFSGRIEPVETAQIAGNDWYLFGDVNRGDRANYRWGMLQGYEAPRVRMDEPFGRQGMAMSVEHDFGVGAVDYRHGYKNPGAAG